MSTRRTSTLILAGAALVTALTITACSGTPAATPPDRTGIPLPSSGPRASEDGRTQTDDIAITHIHAAVRDPKTHALLLATHEGLFRQEQGALRAVGPVIDLMGFTVTGDGTYYASGHPGPQTDLPQPVGLITSRDAGQTWQVTSRGGESDFHAMAVTPTAIVGFDGALRISRDRTSWSQTSIASPPRALAAAPRNGALLATTAAGLLRSDDDGTTWRALSPPELLVVVAWADDKTVVAATTSGRIATSPDAGTTWTLGRKPIGQIDEIWATRTPGGHVETIAVIGTNVIRTLDAGETTETLVGADRS